jgi:peptide/nickel transport system permease protein
VRARRFIRTRAGFFLSLLVLLCVFAFVGPLVVGYGAQDLTAGVPLSGPSLQHPLGVDAYGRDELSRVAAGIRISLGVSLVVALVAMAVGIPLGLLLGYSRGRVDFVAGRVLDLMFAFPGILLALVLATALGPSLKTAAVAMCLIYIPQAVRYVRAAVAAEAVKDYVVSQRVLGAPTSRILFRHLLPNILGDVLVITALLMSFAVLTEAALSFLGVGAQAPSASLGRLLIDGRNYLGVETFLALFPALAVSLLVGSLNGLGDALREQLGVQRPERAGTAV